MEYKISGFIVTEVQVGFGVYEEQKEVVVLSLPEDLGKTKQGLYGPKFIPATERDEAIILAVRAKDGDNWAERHIRELWRYASFEAIVEAAQKLVMSRKARVARELDYALSTAGERSRDTTKKPGSKGEGDLTPGGRDYW